MGKDRKVLLQINSTLNKGSTGRIAEQIGILAQQEGWSCYILHGPRYVNSSSLKSIQTVSLSEEKFAALQTRLFDNHGLSSAKSTMQIISKIREINPTIIHLHNIHGYYINYKILFEFLSTLNIPIVWTLHDCWSFTGHCYHFSLIGCEKWKSLCFECPQKKEYPASLLLDRSKRNYLLKRELFTSIKNLTIVPVSGWLEGILKESFFKDTGRIKTIRNGIDINIFRPYNNENLREKYFIKDNDFVIIGCATSWNKSKGLYDYISLSRSLPKGYVVVLIGVSKDMQEQFPSNLIGITRTENQMELAELYSMANVYANLSYQETFPTVNIEALACGIPVVTYNTGGSPESIDEETGFVVEQGDILGVVKAINLINDKGKEYYKSKCRERAIKYFDKQERFKEYIDLYKEILQINNN